MAESIEQLDQIDQMGRMSIDQACTLMSEATDRDGILRALLCGAADHLLSAQIFFIKGQTLKGLFAFDDDQLIEIKGKTFTIDESSVAAHSVTHGLIYLGPVSAEDVCASVSDTAEDGLVIVPITMGRRTVCLLLGSPREHICRELRDEMAQLAYHASLALATLMGKAAPARPPAAEAAAPAPATTDQVVDAQQEPSAASTVVCPPDSPADTPESEEGTISGGPARPVPTAAVADTITKTVREESLSGADLVANGRSDVETQEWAVAPGPDEADVDTPAAAGEPNGAQQWDMGDKNLRQATTTTQWPPWAALGVSQTEPGSEELGDAAAEVVDEVDSLEGAESAVVTEAADADAPAVPLTPKAAAGTEDEPVLLTPKAKAPEGDDVVPLTKLKLKRVEQRAPLEERRAPRLDPRADEGHVSASELGPLEHREYDRLPLVVEVHHASEHNFFTGFMEDISEGGLFVATHAVMDIGKKLELTFTVPGMPGSCTARCRVRWTRDYNPDSDGIPGMGLSFDDLAPDARAVIERFLKQRQPIFFDD